MINTMNSCDTPSYQLLADALVLHAPGVNLKLTPYFPGCIRIQYSARKEFNDQKTWMVQIEPPAPPTFSIKENSQSLIFSTSQVTIAINKQTLAFTYLDAMGEILTREPQRGGKNLEPIEVDVNIYDPAAVLSAEQGADGVKIRARGAKKTIKKHAFHAKLAFDWAVGEALYGLGSHEEGMLNLRGQHQFLYQQNMKVFIPVLVSTRGYGIVFDQYSLMTFHDDAFGSYLWMDVVDELDYYFIYGPEFDQIIHTIRTLTGAAPMLPRWAFGYIQSKERYATQNELIEIVQEYRRRNLPIDGVVLDWLSWPDKLWGQKTLDPSRFADPSQMMHDLHDLHAHLMISIWPNMSPGGENWQEMADHGFLLGNQSTYDAFNPAARELYWKHAHDGLFSHGIDAWWCDCTEPFGADWRGAVKPEPEEQMRINTSEAKNYLDPALINAYSLLHSKGIYESQRNSGSEKRVLNLTRSGYLGQQRYATMVWSGDISANWATLRKQIAEGLNFCVTGMPYWTLDIGAFFVKKRPDLWFWNGDYDRGVEDAGYCELFVRWFQFGAFLPMFRVHGTDTPREIWRFGEPGEELYEALVSMLKLRYRLLPYLYSLAGWTTLRHYTMLRMLAFDFRNDANARDIKDQFLLGPSLMVNPVTQAMYFGENSLPVESVEKTRPVYLPQAAGTGWFDFWTGKFYEGGQTLQAEAPIHILPLFVRSGSILPLGPELQFADQSTGEPIELWVYSGQNCDFVMYLDEGDRYTYEQGAYATIRMVWRDDLRCLTLDDCQGAYPGMPKFMRFKVMLWSVDGTKSDPRWVDYHGDSVSIYFAAGSSSASTPESSLSPQPT